MCEIHISIGQGGIAVACGALSLVYVLNRDILFAHSPSAQNKTRE